VVSKAFIPYEDQGYKLEGFLAHPEGVRPAVIFCHAWQGRSDLACKDAERLANFGFVGFALDMYGKGILGKSKQENAQLKKPFLEDRHLLQRRVIKAYEVVSELPMVDKHRIAVVGFGFGALCALDLARAGVDLEGAVSVYGHFNAPPAALIKPIRAKLLILHGYSDPVSPIRELRLFEEELEKEKVDWQVHLFGGAMHAFATPGSNDKESGIIYNPVAAARTWHLIHQFLNEIFSPQQFL